MVALFKIQIPTILKHEQRLVSLAMISDTAELFKLFLFQKGQMVYSKLAKTVFYCFFMRIKCILCFQIYSCMFLYEMSSHKKASQNIRSALS